MPVASQTGWRLYPGWVTSTSVTTAYAIEALALQSDQNFATPWTINAQASDFPTLPQVVTTANLARQGAGFIHWRWRMDYMTFGMLSYWVGRFLPGITFTSGTQNAQVTAMLYDAYDVASFVQAYIYLPAKLTRYVGGYRDVDWQFEYGIVTA